MTNYEIRDKIKQNNERIMQLINPHRFVLNSEISELLEENRKLQAECNHTFESGKCIYCGKEEEK